VSKEARDEPAVVFLAQLLSRSERTPDRARPASAAPNYDALQTAEMVARFQSQIVAAEATGAVTIRYGKRERRHLIDRVTVRAPAILARHLGRTPSASTARNLRSELNPLTAGAAPWVAAILDEMEGKWSRGEPAYRLSLDDTRSAAEFLSLLAAISAGKAEGADARTFSLTITGDSKAFDRHASRLASVLAPRIEVPATELDMIWKRIGLERYAHPVHIRGPVLVGDVRNVWVDGMAAPFASVHPEMLPLLRLTVLPALLLTIENYTSFNRYVREVSDGALVVYTGGFASTGTIEVLKSLVLDPTVPLFHWGDIDPGGLRIFRFLEESLPRRPLPHLMECALAETHGKPAPRDPTLAQLSRSDSTLAELARWLAEGTQIRHLEQEALQPQSPLIAA
jgi:hypothetical protein